MSPLTIFFRRISWRILWLCAALLLYFALSLYQLGLPGLHYDEAKEAGVNAMEVLTGAPVSAFREASISLFGVNWPLMVQDYIGALNVYLALPLLALTGIGVPNLRLLSVLTGALGVLALERAVSQWVAWLCARSEQRVRVPISLAGLIAATLLVAAPSFVFWSRQGIFVTNLTQPLCFVCIAQGVAWLRNPGENRAQRALLWSAFAGGLALYAKLLAVWIVGPFALLAAGAWLWRRQPRVTPAGLGLALAAFLLPLLPLLLFNIQTGGTFQTLLRNAGESYYGVNNANVLGNLSVRWQGVQQTLRGDHLWYLGGVYANPWAVWLSLLALVAGLLRRPRLVLPPLLLLALALGASLFTVSDLFVTHYALVHPLLIAVVGIALCAALALDGRGESHLHARSVASSLRWGALALFVALWLAADLTTTVRYHGSLTRSGGLADHSDATYHLAYHLQYGGLGAPIALDWGLDAPVRYLSGGTVTPVEIFGYERLDAPDDGFAERLAPFLENPDNVYLLRAPGQTVFAGRREAFLAAVSARNAVAEMERDFTQRDGTPIFELWRVQPQP